MAITLPTFTPLEDSLFLTLYARALDDRRPHPILGDATADQIVRTARLRLRPAPHRHQPHPQRRPPGQEAGPGRRGRSWPATRTPSGSTWAPDSTPARSASTRRPPCDWYDVDFPAVAAARERLIPERPNAHVIGADVREEDWLDAIPTGRPAVIVADGMMGFLTQDELVSLWNRLISHFPSGEIVFNSYTRFAIWIAQARPRHQVRRRPGQVPRHGRPPRTRSLEPQAAAGQGDPAQPGTRGRPVPTGLAPVPPAGSAQHRLVPDRNHRPALPLLKSFAVAHPNT